MIVNKNKLARLRRSRHWSQEDLAAAAQLSSRTVQRLESGGQGSVDTVKAIAAALAIRVDDLAEEPIDRSWIMGPIIGAGGGIMGCLFGYLAIFASQPDFATAMKHNWDSLAFVTSMLAFSVLFPAYMIRRHWNSSPPNLE